MVKQSNVVFLGINQNGSLKNKYIRNAISVFIDRKKICESSYYNYSSPAKSLFFDGMDIIKNEEDVFSTESETAVATALLKKAGYSQTDSSGYYINSSKSRITLDLLYNKDNAYQKNAAELLQKQLSSSGIEISLDGRSYNNYVTAVLHRNYDLYLGEIRLTNDFNYSALFSGQVVAGKTLENTTTTTLATTTANATTEQYSTDEDGDRIYSATTQTTKKQATTNSGLKQVDMQAQYEKYLKGDLSLKKFLESFATEMPFIPIAFRYGVVSYNASLNPSAVSTVSDAYYNIEYLSLKK